MIFTALLLLVPGLIASMIHLKNHGIPFKSIDLILWFFVYAFLINMMVVAFSYLRGHGENTIISLYSSIKTGTKYAALALVGATVLPYAMPIAFAVVAWFSKITNGGKANE